MDIALNWTGILIMTVACFALGALWHGPIFGKLWMKIHHGDKKFTDAEIKKSMDGMWKLMAAEFVATLLMVMTLDFLMKMIPSFSGMHLAFLVWFGYVLPTMISTVVWGGDKKEWMFTKIALSSICRLIGLVAAGYVLGMWTL
jgi:hypothetical protein